MTKIITRVFADEAQAKAAVDRLKLKFVPKRDLRIITGSASAEEQLQRAEVHESAVAPYAEQLANGHTVVVVRAGYKPLGAAKITREVLSKFDTIDVPVAVEESKAPWRPDHAPSILKDHPLFLTNADVETPGRISDGLGLPPLTARKTKHSVMSGDKRISRTFWPMPLLKTDRNATSAIRGGRYMSRAFWPMKLISTAPRRKSVIPGGDLPFSRRLGLKTTI
jgi:hypothetical protein